MPTEFDYAAYGYFTDILTGHLAEHDFTYDIFTKTDKNNLLLRLPLYNYDAISFLAAEASGRLSGKCGRR